MNEEKIEYDLIRVGATEDYMIYSIFDVYFERSKETSDWYENVFRKYVDSHLLEEDRWDEKHPYNSFRHVPAMRIADDGDYDCFYVPEDYITWLREIKLKGVISFDPFNIDIDFGHSDGPKAEIVLDQIGENHER